MNSVTSHPVDREELMAFLDGQPCGDTNAVAAHLESCADCQTLATELRAVSAKLSTWTVDTSSASSQHGVLSAANGGSGQSLLPRKIAWQRWTLGFAGLAVALVVALIAGRPAGMMKRAAVSVDTAVISDPKEIARQDLESARKLEEGKLASGLEATFGSRRPNGHPSVPTDIAVSGRNMSQLIQLQKGAVSLAELQSAGPMIARVANLRVVVPKFEAARASLDAILGRYHGYAATLEVSTTEGSARTITASLRVPAAQMGPALADLKALGRVENESQSGEEVTEQHADLVARLKNSRETEVRLQDILRTRTGKVSDVLEVEQEIARVRGEIERMEAERKGLEHRVDFATVSLSLIEEYKAKLDSSAPSRGTQLRNSLITGLRNASDSFFALVLFLAEALPVLFVWLLILSPLGWFLWRRFRAVRIALT